MKREEKTGFIQLLSKEGEVIRQGKGPKSFIRYFQTQVWSVQAGQCVVFTENSDYVQLFKFTDVLRNDDDVYLYDCNELSIQNYSVEPSRSCASKVVKAKDLENTYPEDLINSDFWVAYCNGKWVGTSEY